MVRRLLLGWVLVLRLSASAQMPVPGASRPGPSVLPLDPRVKATPIDPGALSSTALSPAVLELLQLDLKFSEATAKGGGRAFAEWFASDALTLNNKQAPVMGKTRIAASASWDPKEYQLSWQPMGAQIGPSGDMGFTWGHYEGKSKDKQGQPVVLSGRYITVWKKVDGKWKVALDASAEDAPEAGDCCKLPNP